MIEERGGRDPAEDALLNSEAMNDPLGYAAQLVVEAVDLEKVGALRMADGGDYVLDEGSCWITVGNLSVYVKKEVEGVAVDIYPLNDENSDPVAGTYALFSEGANEAAMTEPKKFLKSKYYPVDVERKIIYDDPANREMDCSVRRGYRELGTIGIKGERINTRRCYQSYRIEPPATSPR